MMATGCQILLCVVLYSARSWYISQEKWVGSEFACFVRLSIVFFECYFKPFLSFGCQKNKTFSGTLPPKPHQGPAMDPIGSLQHLPDPKLPFLYNLGAFGATNVNFFSVLTPGDPIFKS